MKKLRGLSLEPGILLHESKGNSECFFNAAAYIPGHIFLRNLILRVTEKGKTKWSTGRNLEMYKYAEMEEV